MESHFSSVHTLKPASTFLSVGLGSAPPNSTTSKPASLSIASTCAAIPNFTSIASVTSSTLFPPSSATLLPSSFTLPAPIKFTVGIKYPFTAIFVSSSKF